MIENEKQLRRNFGFFTTLSLVIGTVIGSGIFFKQGRVLQEAGSTKAALLAWFVGGVLTLASAMSVAELGSEMPQTGGIYIYIGKIFGQFWGFLAGWMQISFYGPALIASVSFFFSTLFISFFNLPSTMAIFGFSIRTVILVAAVSCLLIALMNMLDNRVSRTFALTTTSLKLIPILALIIFGLFFGHAGATANSVNLLSEQVGKGNFGVAVLSTLFAYDGWVIISNLGGEIKNPQKTLPRAVTLGITIVLIAYMGVSFGVFSSLPAEKIVSLGDQAPFRIMKQAFGPLGGRLMDIGVMISVIGTLNSKILSFPRVVFEMADQQQLPFSNLFHKLGKKSKTPNYATAFEIVVAILLLNAFSSSQDLSDWLVFVSFLFYLLTFIAVFILRHQLNRKPHFAAPLHPLFPLLAIIGTIFIEVSTIVNAFSDPTGQQLFGIIISLLIVAIGIPLYYLQKFYKL
ncbi:amino acid permease [Oenococcus sicerae]|uniref:Amino acid permease n=1 Tax=Oenococcus sicerae TaxID=2203724 RepID=A0ABX5QL77_9LACO|nr:amino acid permease [Oenococcus sicerae]QAS69524.1 amino acid permease [Oenococcus sicerae]